MLNIIYNNENVLRERETKWTLILRIDKLKFLGDIIRKMGLEDVTLKRQVEGKRNRKK